MLADPDQDGNHRQLKNIDHRGADPTGAFDAEHHRQRLKSEFTVALNAFEVVDDSDAKTRKAVGQGEQCSAPGQLPKQGLAGPPGQGDVAGA